MMYECITIKILAAVVVLIGSQVPSVARDLINTARAAGITTKGDVIISGSDTVVLELRKSLKKYKDIGNDSNICYISIKYKVFQRLTKFIFQNITSIFIVSKIVRESHLE
jgi:hypothetical protein